MFRARLKFQDGASFDLPVEDGQTVVDAAMMLDAPLRYDCSSGTCGTCIGRIEVGQVDRAACEPSIVTQAECDAGIFPTCLTRLASDATFYFDYPLHPSPSPAARQPATVTELTQLGASVMRLRMELAAPEDFRFQSGQYLRFRPPGLRVARAYSIASAPAELPEVELLIRLVPGGQVSTWLANSAKVGDRVTVHGPLGGFALDDRADRQVFIAGGTGLAPILSMLRQPEMRHVPKLLCFGCTRLEDLFLVDELHGLTECVPELEVRIAAVEAESARVMKGTAVSMLRPDDLLPGTTFHLCGPPGMVDAARNLLATHDVPPHALRAERFQPGG